MTASPARSLIERAADIYGYDELWSRAEAPVRAPVAAASPQPPVSLAEATPAPSVDAAVPPTLIRARIAPTPAASAFDAARLADGGFVRPGAPPTMLSEELRIAKRPLLLAAFGDAHHAPVERGRVLLVASANPGDGKTFCAVNLALSLAAERDTEVLLIDGDVAKPSIPGLLGIDVTAGLTDAIADADLDLETLAVATPVPQLRVLAAGRPVNDATELLGSAAAGRLLARLAAADPRRLIVLDSPPLLAASPGAALALHAGQVVLVVRADRTSEGDLRDAYALVSRNDQVHLLLNGVGALGAQGRYGSYYGAAA